MWSCIACAITIRFRMYCAFSGTSRPSAFSTVLTDAIAWTVVQTPQKRWVKSHASRGSRPFRIVSIPRNIWPDDQAFFTRPPSTSTSTRRWPSMRVTGSTTIRLDIRASLRSRRPRGRAGAVADRIGKYLTIDDVQDDLERHDRRA